MFIAKQVEDVAQPLSYAIWYSFNLSKEHLFDKTCLSKEWYQNCYFTGATQANDSDRCIPVCQNEKAKSAFSPCTEGGQYMIVLKKKNNYRTT